MKEKSVRKGARQESMKESRRESKLESKGNKRFGELFGSAWRSTIDNFGFVFKIGIILYLIPQIISLILYGSLLGFDNALFTVEDFIANPSSFIIVMIFSIIVFLISLLFSLTVVYIAVNDEKKHSVLGAIKDASKFYWRYLGLFILMSLALIGLFILLIVPGIIFAVYWVFAVIILVYEKKRIIESFKASKAIVKGRWWKVFGYMILSGLIAAGLSLAISLFGSIFAFATLSSGSVMVVVSNIIQAILGLVSTALVSLLYAYFFKYFYLDLKK